MVSEVAVHASPDGLPPGEARQGHAHVLVVSSLPVLRQSLAGLLTEAGYWISVARSSAEVTDELARSNIDLLLVTLPMAMPRCSVRPDGRRTCQ